jgi:hypothetical protein
LFAIKGKKWWGGVGAQSAPIAAIAVIADIARDRKTKNLTTDQHG